jgi:hypothetical protein
LNVERSDSWTGDSGKASRVKIKGPWYQLVFRGLGAAQEGKIPCNFSVVCLNSPAGKDFDATKVSQIVKGKTTSNDLLAMFGTPYSKQPKDNDEEMWVYSYAEATAHAQSMGFGVTSSEATGFKKSLYSS